VIVSDTLEVVLKLSFFKCATSFDQKPFVQKDLSILTNFNWDVTGGHSQDFALAHVLGNYFSGVKQTMITP